MFAWLTTSLPRAQLLRAISLFFAKAHIEVTIRYLIVAGTGNERAQQALGLPQLHVSRLSFGDEHIQLFMRWLADRQTDERGALRAQISNLSAVGAL